MPPAQTCGKPSLCLPQIMTRTNGSDGQPETKAPWSVVVVYEDPAARERAVGFCDQLVARFWEQFEFDVSWWSFALLGEPGSARQAAQKAAGAGLVVIAATPEGDFSIPVKAWIESWLALRGEREGILACLLEPAAGAGNQEGPKHRCLRDAAHRGAMDFLTQVPQGISRTIPDSLESYTSRADEVTSVLDNILRQQAPPPSLLS